MKVKPKRKHTDISDALLDDFFKGDENYTGNVEAGEEERSEHDNENAEMRKVLQELVDIGCQRDFQEKHHKDLFEWIDAVDGIINRATELIGGEQSAKV